MLDTVYEVVLDVNSQKVTKKKELLFNENDLGTSKLVFTVLKDTNPVTFEDADTFILELMGSKEDSVKITIPTDSCVLADDKKSVTVTLTGDVLSVPDTYKFILVLKNGENVTHLPMGEGLVVKDLFCEEA